MEPVAKKNEEQKSFMHSGVPVTAPGKKTAGEWMHRGVVSCSPDTSAEAVVKLMDAEDVSALVVVSEDGDVAGVISRTDLVSARFVPSYTKPWAEMRAEHLMTWPAVCVTPATSILDAARLLGEKHLHRLVVVEQEAGYFQPVGILSVTDLARHALEQAL